MVHLHTRSWFSFLAGASSPQALVDAAARDGQRAMALTDVNTVAGVVQFAEACRNAGIKPIFGSEVTVDGYPLVLIAADREGYANLNDLLTAAHRERQAPGVSLEQLDGRTEGLICLTGDRFSQLTTAMRLHRYDCARQHLSSLKWLFHKRLFVELTHHQRPSDTLLRNALHGLANGYHVPVVATNAVRHATPTGYAVYDALTCAGLGISIADPHVQRPVNKQAYVCTTQQMRDLGFSKRALANSDAIADVCNVNLLADAVVPPEALIPDGSDAASYLRSLCFDAFLKKYPAGHKHRSQAASTLRKEIHVITELGLEEFFLVVREVMAFARRRGIRCSGRGSAANSVAAYLLGITGVDPIENGLLFERFLHMGRRGMPDIDCDFETHRRDEVIHWMEQRFGESHTAMTANLITFRLRLAVREVAKVLGYPLPVIDIVTKAIPHGYASNVRGYRAEIAAVLGESPLLDVLISLVESLNDCPRHLSLHSGGMILSRLPLRYLSPVQTSANGVRQMVFNKDDAERLSLIKFDVLGLRTLSVVSEALGMLKDETGDAPDVDALPLDDAKTFELIRAGKTMSVFQIESPGQWNLISKSQPEKFTDLISQVALFRPGPLQAHMVHPFIARRRGLERVKYLHPSLEPCLKDTYGIILYQEQVLEVAHIFAGLSLSEADDFRRLMSKFRSSEEMEGMRAKFVNGAVAAHKLNPKLANHVFNQVSKFVGYGFCKSHAAEFAKTVYITAYLKAHHPAAYMAAVLEHKPGFYPEHTILEEARLCGVKVLPVDIRYSDIKYKLEQGAIRVPLTQAEKVSADRAASLVLERWNDPFKSLEDTYQRVRLDKDAWVSLARAGAFDCFGDRRKVLWQLGVLAGQLGTSGQQQLTLNEQAFIEDALPQLEALDLSQILEWDFETQHLTTGEHPMAFLRHELERYYCKPIAELIEMKPKQKVVIAGDVISRQSPPTANGMTFLILEDESGRIPTAIVPEIYKKYRKVLRERGLIVEGILEGSGKGQVGSYRSILIQKMWSLKDIVGDHQGGYSGYPGQMAR